MEILVTPELIAEADASVSNIGRMISDANTAVAAWTTTAAAAGADEVSAAVAALFNSLGVDYQTVAAQAEMFHNQFAQTLASSAAAYEETEFAALQALRTGITDIEQPFIPILQTLGGGFGFGTQSLPAPPLPTVPPGGTLGIIVGGTGYPVVSGALSDEIQGLYFPGIANYASIFTPEQFFPITPWLGGLSLGQSTAQGVALLNTAIHTGISNGNNVTVWGTSQGALVETNEIRNLMASGSPYTDKLSFILTGDPNNPNGGPFERFPGLYIPGLDVLFNGATPPNSPYHTTIYTNQYDGVSDFPRYPLNVVSDANAVFGFLYGNHDYVYPGATSNAVQLPTSPGYTGNTAYYMTLGSGGLPLPLTVPLREYSTALGYGLFGQTIGDLVQPDLRVIVDLGYGSGEYANIPTPASLFELPNPVNIVNDLVRGSIQGPTAALVDLGLLPYSNYPAGQYPFSPVLDPQLNYPVPQGVTGLSLLTGAEGSLAADFGLIPPWDQ